MPAEPTDSSASPARASGSREDFLALLRVPTANTAPDKVDRIVQARLIGLGHGRVCDRCGGSGHYSFNAIDGTTCFGCRGGGHVAQKLTAALYECVAADVAAGKLDTYFAEVRARAAAKKAAATAADRVMAAWRAVVAKFPYDWHLAAQKQQPHEDLADEVNKPMCDAYDKVTKLVNELDSMPYKRGRCKTAEESKAVDATTETLRVQLLAAVDEAMQVIAAAERRGAEVMARHAVPAARAARDDSPSP